MDISVRRFTVNLLNFFLAVVEVFLGIRFLFKLFGANPNNGFVSWVYDMSAALLEPFRGIFSARVFENQYILEFSTLFAMLMYGLLALLIIALINIVTPSDADGVKVVKKARQS